MKNPPAGEEATLVDLLSNCVPAGVDQAAYVKASFLTSIVKVFSCHFDESSDAVQNVSNNGCTEMQEEQSSLNSRQENL